MVKNAIILTGVSRSGKSTYAKHLEKTQGYKHLSFDSFYNYGNPGTLKSNFDKLKNLIGNAEKIVLDGYWSWRDKYFKLFKKEICNDVQSVITIVSIFTLAKRKIEFYGDFKNPLHTITDYVNAISTRIDYKESKFIDTSDNTFKETIINSPEELNQYLIEINKKTFEDYLGILKSYDKFYQDIEVINFKGYSNSKESWEHIKNLVDWKDKFVIELGCFHGYFSFKIEEQKAKVLGFDCHKQVLETARFINWLSNCSVEFKQWTGGDDIPKCDIILCMNVFHNFKKKQDLALSKMNCKQAIFEINKKEIPLIEKYFKIIKEIESHRPNRIILLGGRL